ncbi:uncharacterized protein LAESUDRAFT_764762 [Laetiporus sulphureus 93-53]|uniref:Uncharacterized protein n=1 Tax=Laetiporus sulphureus 93-53 TaxID=1314785 RepID=A0A165B5C5_9APHY|nr:uncharacterized protein LAESUDRAFT_764762 [Laetiporus sulphureus 93-53]KZT00274.1 hypothetical protein LAESUDRAFT_764762 [Laetiporus sulphureus 93-53]
MPQAEAEAEALRWQKSTPLRGLGTHTYINYLISSTNDVSCHHAAGEWQLMGTLGARATVPLCDLCDLWLASPAEEPSVPVPCGQQDLSSRMQIEPIPRTDRSHARVVMGWLGRRHDARIQRGLATPPTRPLHPTIHKTKTQKPGSGTLHKARRRSPLLKLPSRRLYCAALKRLTRACHQSITLKQRR